MMDNLRENEAYKISYESYIGGLNRIKACKKLIDNGFGTLRDVEPITRKVYNVDQIEKQRRQQAIANTDQNLAKVAQVKSAAGVEDYDIFYNLVTYFRCTTEQADNAIAKIVR